MRRLEPFGLAEHVGAIVLAAPRPGGAALAEAEAALAAALRGGGGARRSSRDRRARLRAPAGPRRGELFALAERVGARVARALDARRPARRRPRGRRRAQARRAFHEARCALEARALRMAADADRERQRRRPAERGATVATYRDLGSFQLLLSLQDDDALRLFCDSLLAPIEQTARAPTAAS